MQRNTETVLAILPGENDGEQLAIVLRMTVDGSRIELRQQSWGEGVGWFSQTSVQLNPEQVAGLRNTLGLAPSRQPRTARPASQFEPQVLRFESA